MRIQLQQAETFIRRERDGYFFATPALRLRLDLAREYICCGETPVLVIGDTGAGKTAFLNQLLCRADHYWRSVRVPAVSSFSPSDVITFLNAELRLPVRASTDDMLGELDRWLERIAVRDQIAVVAVDDAHGLSDESLAQLVALPERSPSCNCRVLITGEPRLQARLKGLQGNSRCAEGGRIINIPSLDKHEVASYIDMKLYYAGMEGKGPFKRTVIDHIARNSHGHPGRINAIASDLLNGERRGLRWRRTSDQLQRIIRRLSIFRDSRLP